MEIRVLHVLPHPGGGAETYIGYLKRLEIYTHELFPLSSGRSPQSALSSLPTRWPRLIAHLKRADILHCHGDAAALLTWPMMQVCPSVTTTHGLNLFRRQTGWRRRGVARALTRAGAVVCTSAAERAELESFLPSSLGKLHTILNGVDQAGPIDASRRTAMRRGLGIDPDTVLGLFVGGLEDLKAPLLAATAAEQVRTGGTRLVLAFVGTGPLEAAVRDLRSSAVRLLGFRSDVPELLSAADMLIHPSEREGLPYSVLEAMAHGVPVIGTDCPGTREAVATTGVLVPNGDERSLAEAMTRLAKDDRLRISLGRAARARAADHFGVGVFLAKTAQLYRELTNPRLSPGPGRPSTVPLSD